MSFLSRFDSQALRPPSALADGPVPAELLAWCRQSADAFAWRETALALPALEALMRELDGDRALQALPSGAARWQLRLGLKLREALGRRRATDPWDAGHATDTDALLHFLPRRPTLILSEQAGARAVLAARAPLFSQPVRLLLRPAA